jgi:hypothetical protein
LTCHKDLILADRGSGVITMAKKKLSIEDILENLRAQIDLLEDKINDIQDQSEPENWDDEEDLDDEEDE